MNETDPSGSFLHCLQIFSHILQREFQESYMKHLSRKFTEWVYGPVHCYLYDVASLDSYEDNSVMEILIYSSDIPVSAAILMSPFRASIHVILYSNICLLASQNRHEMLQTEPLSQLLEEKWKKFAGQMFFFHFLVYFLYLIIFTIMAYNKKNGEVSCKLRD